MGYLELPEKELVQRAVAGDQMAYRAIYQLHEKAIRSRVSGYFQWKADVDDVVSESFQKAFVNLSSFIDADGEIPVKIGRHAIRRSFLHDGGPDDPVAVGSGSHDASHFDLLGEGREAGEQKEGCENRF